MKRILAMAGTTLLVLVGGACGEGAEDEVALEEPIAVVEPGVAPVQPQAGAVLEVDTLQGVGPYLTDEQGRALYLLEADPQRESTCYDRCAEVWPPYLAPQGTPTAGAAPVQESLIGTLQRRDGSIQVTYGGHPLYYYVKDEGPEQATGQDVHDEWGEWYLVRPSGEPLEGHGGGTENS